MKENTLLFASTHEWIKKEGELFLVGISDYAQDTLGSVVFVDLPSVGDVFDQEEIFGAVESVKAASDLYAPVKCEVVAVNQTLEDAPELLNDAPFETWILKVKVLDDKGFEKLLNQEDYDQSH